MRRLSFLLAGLIALSGCSFGGPGPRTYRAEFSRAIQVFPAVKVRVLGVDVGVVTDVRNARQGVEVTFRIDDPEVKLPADVGAAVVPMSLLGERYIQLVPAYSGGPTLPDGATIPASRTAVPAEPDELLRSLQDYLGEIDPENVTSLVENAAAVVEGRGEDLNRLIEHGAGTISALSEKRDDLAQLIVELDKLTVALSTRQAALGRLIRNYGEVTGTLVDNRSALEGTITGLSQAASELASLLVAHQDPLRDDIETLTTSGRTLDRNIDSLALTAKWATRLFKAASRAVDYDKDWLRLSNQGFPLEELILRRLQERLKELCEDSGFPECESPAYWAARVPGLFCFQEVCPKPGPPGPTEEKAMTLPSLASARSARTWWRTAGAALVVWAVASVVLASCSSSSGFTLKARFSDVSDLTKGAPVMMADITVGKVTGIELDGYSALVTMAIQPGIQVPADVTARVRRTSLLGERIVDLVVPGGDTGKALLKDGATIRRTEARPDLEDLVREGTAVLGPITESEVATLVNEGYKGFGGRGPQLRALLDNFGVIVKAYAGETDTIRSLIESMNQLNTTVALKAAAHEAALGNSERALTMLRQESGRLESAIKALNRLSVGARRIMDQHADEMGRFFSQMQTILGVLEDQRAAIVGLLKFAPLHNRNTQLVEFWEFNQILQDFVICGFNEDKKDPARTCTPGRSP